MPKVTVEEIITMDIKEDKNNEQNENEEPKEEDKEKKDNEDEKEENNVIQNKDEKQDENGLPELLAESGLVELRIGLESASYFILKLMINIL